MDSGVILVLKSAMLMRFTPSSKGKSGTFSGMFIRGKGGYIILVVAKEQYEHL